MTTHPADLRQQPGVCTVCNGDKRGLYAFGCWYKCDACNGTGQQPSALDRYNADLGRALRAAGVGQQPAQPGSGEALPRFGLQWNGPRDFVCTPMPDGYWTPWHVAHDALTAANQHVRILQEQQEEYGRERAAERGKLAVWMIQHNFVTGHGDTIDDLLAELGSQVDERAQRLTAAQQRIAALESENADLRARLNHSERLQGRYPRDAV